MSFLLSLCMLAAAQGDTLSVQHAQFEGPHLLQPAWQTDTTTLSGERYDATEILKNNASLALRPMPADANALLRGQTVGCAAEDSTASLTTLRFMIDAHRFTKCKLDAQALKKNKVYLDGKEVNVKDSNYELRLIPGRHDVTILDYVAAGAAPDTFALKITGNDLSHLTVNPTTPRSYDLDINTHGPRYGGLGLSPSGRYAVTHYQNVVRGGENIWSSEIKDLQTGKKIYAGDYRRFQWFENRDAVYYTRKGSNGLELIELDVATMTEKTLATALPDGNFQMSPDETFVIISRSNEGPKPKGALKSLYDSDDRMLGWRNRTDPFILHLKTGVLQRITFGRESCYVMDIAPDGSRILMSISHHDATRLPMDRSDILEYDVKTGKTTTVLKDAEWLNGGQYAPNGKDIVFTGTGAAFSGIGAEVSEGQHPMSYQHTLFLYNRAEGKATHLLPGGFKPSVGTVKVNTADGLLYLTCEDGYDRTLWTLNPQTLERRRFDFPVSYLLSVAISNTRAPRCIFSGQTGTKCVAAYSTVLDPKLKTYEDRTTYGTALVRGEKIDCVEKATRPDCKPFGELQWEKLYPNVQVPSCTEWAFQASRGDKVKGFYFLPPDFKADAHYTMTVYYYGGCTPTSRLQRYAYPLAAISSMGYVVLVLEPSGASGFGQEFAARHVGTWGDESSDDIIEGVQQFCEEHSFVDASKVGCMGASYGGFMTQYLQTRTDIFAAAVSHAGISNIASYWGGGYWGYSYGEVAEYGQFPWNNPKLFTEHSPLFNADKIHTPILLLHGTADTNVPTNESQQLFTALKMLGREVSYIQVDGENHIINDYAKREQWMEAILAWFAKHLQCDSTWWDDLGY